MRLFLAILLLLPISAAFAQSTTNTPVSFKTVDIYVDAGQTPLAAYQVEFKSQTGNVKIAGVEGGEHAAFNSAPYYDPKAMQQNRVVIAAFSTAENLPRGRTRIATIHVQVSGNQLPDFVVKLEAAADAAGKRISAQPSFEERKQP